MLRRRLASASLVAGVLLASSGFAGAAPRALLELFTSQGCSSCPPADKMLGEFAKDPSLIALSLPIDIWDYLGWKDTLALPGHTARQRAYAEVRGDRQVYTPQLVINGSMHVVGSDSARRSSRLASSPRSLSAGGQDEQPWLVNSSTTARGSAIAGPPSANPVSAAAVENRASFAVTAHQSMNKMSSIDPSVGTINPCRNYGQLYAIASHERLRLLSRISDETRTSRNHAASCLRT